MPPTCTSDSLPLGPVTRAERIEVLDILRGWAIFGVLLVNFSFDLDWSQLFDKLWADPVNQAGVVAIQFLFKEKFYTLLSFLFGLGFSIQMGRVEGRGTRFLPLYLRKLIGLLVLGFLHFMVWNGDELTTYAELGFLLLLFRNSSPRAILAGALTCFLGAQIYFTGVNLVREYRREDPRTARAQLIADGQRKAEEMRLEQEELRVGQHGSFRQSTQLNARWYYRKQTRSESNVEKLGSEFPLLLLGLYAGRRRIFENLAAHMDLVRRVFWWGLGLGVVCLPVYIASTKIAGPAWPVLTLRLGYLLDAIGSPALAFFYAAAIILLVQRQAWHARLGPLAAVGRLALTNYLCQTAFRVAMFNGYGLGLYAKLGPLAGAGLALLFFPLQVLFSVWWLKRFRFGPIEWLWRSFTYGSLQRFRRPAAIAPAPLA